MRILAIDPGTRMAGFALVEPGDQVIDAGAIKTHGLRLGQICGKIDELAGQHRASMVVVERPGAWMNVARAKGVARNLDSLTRLYELIGAILGAMAVLERPCYTVMDSEAKEALAGRKSAKKNEVHSVLMAMGIRLPRHRHETCADCREAGADLRGLSVEHSPDAADAIAIGIYAARRASSGSSLSQS